MRYVVCTVSELDEGCIYALPKPAVKNQNPVSIYFLLGQYIELTFSMQQKTNIRVTKRVLRYSENEEKSPRELSRSAENL